MVCGVFVVCCVVCVVVREFISRCVSGLIICELWELYESCR